ncbi:MAG: LPS assembly lipoprotein LptE [Bacteroidetes bacterium]|nr:LPS assembly lipoprotein LptE [Bacteroidota bacterium]
MKINIWKSFLLLSLTVMVSGCGIYKFTSVEFNKDLKTFSIQNFTMATAGGPPNLTLNFNEKLKEYYQRNTDLKFRTSDGDLHLEGTIIAYELSPISATAGDKAAMNRLTITVQVKFTNKLQEEQNFDKDFSFYQDFPQDQSLSQVEPNLVPKILDQLVLNIFNSTAATW